MKAHTFWWLVFLALIKNGVSDSRKLFQLEGGLSLTAKEGSCIEIKCINTYSISVDSAYWFWIKDRHWVNNDYGGTIIYSTNKSLKPVSPDFADRVEYIGSDSSWRPANSLWSILICDLKTSDSGKYSFRYVVKHPIKWATDEVSLTVEENPCLITFEKPPAVKETETVTLTCTTLSTCQSSLEIEAFDLKKTPNKEYEQHKTTFDFTADWKDDGKKFSCQTQDQKYKYRARNISITVEYAPKEISATIRPERPREGQSVTLTCSAKGGPNPTYTWLKNGQIQSSRMDNKSHEWTIMSINIAQSGEYNCEAQNKHGKIKSYPIIIDVTYTPKVQIKMSPSRSAIRERDGMTLKCDVMRSNPQPSSYTWFKDGKLICWSQTYNVNSIKPEDSGSYTCTATNTMGTGTSDPFQVEVVYKPRKTNILSSGSHEKVGRPLIFTCKTEANPVPDTYSWFRVSKNKQTDSSQWTSQTTSTDTLRLNSVQRADEACYFCNATNRIDTGEQSQWLCIQVLYPPTNVTLSMDTEVREGQLITITCTVESFPLSDLTLMRTPTSSNQSLDSHITKSADYSQHKNIFSKTFAVTLTHAGFYSCHAKNSEGAETSEERKLVVKYTPRNVTVKAQPDVVVNENTLLTLVCTAQAYPPVTSVTWMRMIDGKDTVVHRFQPFTLKSVTPADSGLYSCTASNDIGSGRSQPVVLKVKYAPKDTKITRRAQQQLTDGIRAVTLSCSSHSYPPVKRYVWYMKMDGGQKDREVSTHQNYTVHSDKPGVYYCVAENEINTNMSDPVEMFVDRGFAVILSITFFTLLILFIITAVLFIYRRNKSIQQGTSNRQPWWRCFRLLACWNGGNRRNLMSESGLARPSRSRDDLLPQQPRQPRRPKAQPCQPRPDRTAVSSISSVYCTINLPRKQVPAGQGGHTEDDFAYKQKPEEDMYAVVSKQKPPKKNDREMPVTYENMSTAHAAKSLYPINYDTDTSEDEVELDYTQVTFNPKVGHQRAKTDSSTSEEEYETQYTEVKL
ncbi:hypothetical protein PAMA_015479 [Pampus argenteus]